MVLMSSARRMRRRSSAIQWRRRRWSSARPIDNRLQITPATPTTPISACQNCVMWMSSGHGSSWATSNAIGRAVASVPTTAAMTSACPPRPGAQYVRGSSGSNPRPHSGQRDSVRWSRTYPQPRQRLGSGSGIAYTLRPPRPAPRIVVGGSRHHNCAGYRTRPTLPIGTRSFAPSGAEGRAHRRVPTAHAVGFILAPRPGLHGASQCPSREAATE